MNELEAELIKITSRLDQLQAEDEDKSKSIQHLLSQIEELRAQVSRLSSERTSIRQEKRKLEVDRDSKKRQLELIEEQKKIEAKWNLIREEAYKILSEAPYYRGDLGENYKIKDYQIEGAMQLASAKRGILADERGLGKTLQALAWRRLVKSKRTLFLTRKEYAKRVVREIKFWEPDLTVFPMIGSNTDYRDTLLPILKSYDDYLVVANFEMWRRNLDEVIPYFTEVGYDAVIVDEAHNLKTTTTATTRGFMRIASQVPSLLEITGTPVQNRPQELFALLHAAYPKLFPRPSDFVRDYCYQVGQNRWTWRPGGAEALAKKMSQFFVRRTVTDIGIDKPPPAIYEDELTFEGYEKQQKLYRSLAADSLVVLENLGKAFTVTNVLAVATRLAQAVAWPAGITLHERDDEGNIIASHQVEVFESVKIDHFEKLITDLVEEEQRVVLFSRFIPPIEELHARLNNNGISAGIIHGQVPDEVREDILVDFDLKTARKNPKYSVLLATYQTVSESVDLNAARHLCQFDRFWKPSSDSQAIGRIDRMNNTDQASVYRAVVENTIDVWMRDLIADKSAMLSEFNSAEKLRDSLRNHLEASL